LELTLETDGLRLRPQAAASQASAQELIGCAGYQGPVISLEQLDPALYASRQLP
jgi:hypothetical protein